MSEAVTLPPTLAALSGRIEALCKVPPPQNIFTGIGMGFLLSPEQLLPATRIMLEEEYFLEDVAVVDVQEGFLVNYHFDRFDRHERVVFRIIVEREAAAVPSIVSIFTGADWHERECRDFYGLDFTGHPNLKPLLLPDDMTEPPLLKGEGLASVYDILPLCRLVDAAPGEQAPDTANAKAADAAGAE